MLTLLRSSLFVSGVLGAATLGRRDDLWQPAVGAKIQMMISGVPSVSSSVVPTDVGIFDVDLFETPSSTIDSLHARGVKVICYFSAGTSEDWRPDYNQFTDSDKGSGLPDWQGEKYLNLRSANVLKIMKARIAKASGLGCDAIDPDNMDGFSNTNGLGLTAQDSTNFMRALAAEAAKYSMSTGLKNAQSILGSVQDVVQFAVNEECKTVTKDCNVYDDFVTSKPVFHVEYVSSHSGNTVQSSYDGYQNMSSDQIKAAYCLKDNPTESAAFSTIIKTLALDGWVLYCDGESATTPAIAGSNDNSGGSNTPDAPDAPQDGEK